MKETSKNRYSNTSNNKSVISEKISYCDNNVNIDVIQTIKEINFNFFPIFIYFISIYFHQTINLIFISNSLEENKRKSVIDAIGICHVYINCGLLSIVLGITTGFDTLASNSYGDKKYYLFGIYYHRAQLISFCIIIPLIIFHYIFCIRIIKWMGFNEDVMLLTEEYINMLLLMCILEVQVTINFKYLSIMEKTYANMIINISYFFIHPVLSYLLINLFGLGIKGAGLSLIFSRLINLMGSFGYVYLYNPLPDSVFMYNKDSFKGWWEYLKIAIPSASLMCFEWWAFEILAILALWMGSIDYTVHILVYNNYVNLFQISYSLNIAATIIVGSKVTNHSIIYIKKLMMILLIYGFTIGFLFNFIFFIYRSEIINIYIKDEEINSIGSKVIIICNLFYLMDTCQFICNGFMKAIGKQLIASVVTFINFYFTMTLLAILLGKTFKLGVYGIWIACFISAVSNLLSYYYFLSNFNWHSVQNEIHLRINNELQSLSDNDKNKKLIKLLSTTDVI